MRAILQSGFGRPGAVLSLGRVERPSPGPGEVLVGVRASGIAKGVWLVSQGLPYIARPVYGILRPRHRVGGLQFSGTVHEVGPLVSGVSAGEAVFGFGHGLAEFVVVQPEAVAKKPARLSFEQAAAAPISGLAALQAVRDGARVKPGDRVLVLGASGSVGSFAVQIAKAWGAEVTGVASTRNLTTLWALGADRVVDYTREDPAGHRCRYDAIIDIAGNRPVSRLRHALAPKGSLVMVGGTGGRWTMGFERTVRGMLTGWFVRHRIVGLISKPNSADLALLAALMGSGKVIPVVRARYALNRAPAAVEAAGESTGAGTVVVAIR
ncbi:Phenolphthiocerol synthesis polyketide synthase type I Pks15/1 [bacterium HR33]|nr:Phenolphthiocerol synthesis polyketide synthase type I Pks15/1 [bacterium HR33]